MLITLAVDVSAFEVPYESWMGAYVGEKKVGYLSFKIDEGEFQGTKGYRISSVLNNQLMVLGVELTQLVTTVVHTDSNYKPLMEDFAMSSGGKTTRIRGAFKEDSVECVISAGSGSSTKSIPIPDGANLVGDALFALVEGSVEVGKVYKLHYFNPLTLSIDPLEVTVERKEEIEIDGEEHETLVMKNVTPMGEMTVWQQPGGDILQVHAMMGIRMIRQSRQDAMSGIESGTESDFAVITSVKPNVEIPSPRSVKRLSVILQGLGDPRMAVGDSRQKITPVEGQPADYRFDTSANTFNAASAVDLPVEGSRFTRYVSSTPYLDCNVAAVKETADEVVGDEKNAYTACSKIRKWVNANMTTRADIGITRAASDVLKSKVGVCRDYAILFAALARGVGVPATVVSGLIYVDEAFYYHAWVECYVGEWIPFDATLDTDFVDATHIKLAGGDATSMFGLAKVIGTLKVDVKDFQ